jgi:demethylmenaquinone methyltransferase/2-methoxy-6-polyprenyl-1,4-benzoquinol methylase
LGRDVAMSVPETSLPGPPPEASLPDRRFVQALFDWLEPDYEKAVQVYSLGQDLRWKSELVRRLCPRRGERALDLACGTGLLTGRLARRLGESAVVGLDINRSMLGRAHVQHPRARLVRANSVRLPFADASFDLVTAGYLFKYVSLPALAAEVRRVLRPGGRFGGYDFSAPLEDRASGRLYAPYLRHVLPRVGRWQRRRADRWPELFRFLAQVATASGWETRVEGAFGRAGFRAVVRRPSLGGAITWVWALGPDAPAPASGAHHPSPSRSTGGTGSEGDPRAQASA